MAGGAARAAGGDGGVSVSPCPPLSPSLSLFPPPFSLPLFFFVRINFFVEFISYVDFSIFSFENTNQSKKWRAGAACCGARAAQASADPSICDQKGAIGGASGRRGRLGMGALALKRWTQKI